MLLAAGAGSRFWPYAVVRNKAAFPILNRPLVRRLADTLLEQYRHSRGGRDDAFGSHARFGEAKVQRVVAARREVLINGDEILHAADFGGQDDAFVRQSQLFRTPGALQCGENDCVEHHLLCAERLGT